VAIGRRGEAHTYHPLVKGIGKWRKAENVEVGNDLGVTVKVVQRAILVKDRLDTGHLVISYDLSLVFYLASR
jgi:hypothetical protein